jgi:hypothetical protein
VDEVFRVAILGVICQVHESLLEICFYWGLVLFSAEAGQSLITQERLEGIRASNDYVDSEVELEVVQGQGLGQVPLHGDVFAFEAVG